MPFFRKNPLIWVPFFGKNTPEHGYGSQAASGTFPTNPNVRTPPGSGALPGVWDYRTFRRQNGQFYCVLAQIIDRANFFFYKLILMTQKLFGFLLKCPLQSVKQM